MEPSSEMDESPTVDPVTENFVSLFCVPLPPTLPPTPAQLPVVKQNVPSRSGRVNVLVVPVPIKEASNEARLVASASSTMKVVASTNDLLASVCAWFAKTNVSLAVSAGSVAVRGAVGAIELSY